HYNLTIKNVSSKDEGTYQCQALRTMTIQEAVSKQVQLTIIAHPTRSPNIIIGNMPLQQGTPINVTCLSSPSQPASSLLLYKNNEQLKHTLIQYEHDLKSRKNLTKLFYILSPDITWHNAMLKCEQIYLLSNFKQDVSTRIQVQHKPLVRIESQNKYPLTINSTATFACIVNSNPQSYIKWFANSLDISNLNTPVINIPLSKSVHNHTIGCSATNSIGTTNTSIRILIRYPPTFIIRPPPFYLFEQQNKNNNNVLRCLVDSYPKASVIWYRNGQIIQDGSILNIDNITQQKQEGLYTCQAYIDGFETITSNVVVYIK
ncbi:unnamed protein product, partial [Didymodactylos carnosus]